MKRIFYTVFAAVLVIAASLGASAQSQETRQVSGFNSIASSGPFDVHVNINGTESLKITGKAEILKEIETVVEEGRLKIKFKHHENWDEQEVGKVDIYVTAKSLSGLVNAGSGSIKVEGAVSGSDVDIVLSGSGDIESSIKSGRLHATISGSGEISLKGTADETKISITGSGNLKAKGLSTNSASVMIAGSGSAYITADKTVSASIVGSGSVVYSGNATIGSSHMVGSGSISKER
jgi:hypothetical protein